MATPWNWSGPSVKPAAKPDPPKPTQPQSDKTENSKSRARLLKLGRAKENNGNSDSGPSETIDETLDRLWASGQHDLVEQHLLKGKNNGAAAAKLIAFQKHEITALREEVAEAGAQCRKQETRARELERLLEEVEEHRAMEDKQRAKQEKKTIEEALLRAQAAEAMAAVEKEKRLLLEAALNKLLREWETRQVDLLVTHPTSPEP